ncbi:hypothetical protein FNF29_08475 [Cafeteria roenbergensis]|uniref:Uncharacterized protein n=1 Tax=Cafeteria roenbergensis TaxID=33653 RepID=A0A5A8D811_CAFRO|nr:hypothetical protein FNF29_08475 [Cafeteria roenbergensis]KAA0161652.1 hypothetical protein FNF28_04956 [Cafeteria roenbergensis]|eukprot:KAA0145574.1 hypothetical protein FNF29_08475 [Cafeteria roenbergensis]
MAASGEKAELMGLLAERMQGIAEQAAAVAERTQRASQLAVRARECAELYGGMFKSEPRPDEAYGAMQAAPAEAAEPA